MQDISQTGFLLMFGLAFFLILTWMTGRMSTTKLRSRIAQDVATRFNSKTSKVSVRLIGNTGAKFSFHQESDSLLPKLEATILLLDRSNAFHMIYCRARHRTDQLQIRANLRETPSLKLELVTSTEQKRFEEGLKSESGGMEQLKVDGLTEGFHVVANSPETGQSLFSDQHLRPAFDTLMAYLTRLSIAGREPHLFISAKLVPQAMEPLESFTLALAKYLDHGKKKH